MRHNLQRASLILALLVSGGLRAYTYQPPLTTVGTSLTTNGWDITVHYQVVDPTVGGAVAGSREYGGHASSYWSISDLTSTNGIVAWVATADGILGSGDREVSCAVYDPARRAWREHREHYASSICCPWTVTAPSVVEGVVTWQANGSGLASAFQREVAFATYDPLQGTWRAATERYTGTSSSYWTVTNRTSAAGLVAWRRENIGQFALGSQEVNVAVFDPALTNWVRRAFYYESHLNNPWAVTNLVINNQAVRWFAGSSDETIREVRGYNGGSQSWETNVTTPQSYFAASTSAGHAPLGVWFTDLSLGGTNWTWDFGDTTTSTTRSPYHAFSEPGAYTVTHTVVGPGGRSASELVVVVEAAAGELRFDPSSLRLEAGVMWMEVNGFSGLNPVVLYASENMRDWLAISTNQPLSSPLVLRDPDAGSVGRRFYRALDAP